VPCTYAMVRAQEFDNSTGQCDENNFEDFPVFIDICDSNDTHSRVLMCDAELNELTALFFTNEDCSGNPIRTEDYLEVMDVGACGGILACYYDDGYDDSSEDFFSTTDSEDSSDDFFSTTEDSSDEFETTDSSDDFFSTTDVLVTDEEDPTPSPTVPDVTPSPTEPEESEDPTVTDSGEGNNAQSLGLSAVLMVVGCKMLW